MKLLLSLNMCSDGVLLHAFQFKPVMVKNQEQAENSGRKEGKKKVADKDANPIGAA